MKYLKNPYDFIADVVQRFLWPETKKRMGQKNDKKNIISGDDIAKYMRLIQPRRS